MSDISSSFHWTKLGRVIDPRMSGTPNWISEYAQAPNTLIFPDFVRIFFCSRPPIEESGQYTSRVGFVDVHIGEAVSVIKYSDEPVLTLGELGTFDQFGTYPFSPIKVEGKYIAAYAGWTRCESTPFDVSLGLARGNDDASEFERFSSGPFLTKSIDEPFVISSPKLRYFEGKFYLFYISGKKWIQNGEKLDPVYTIRMAISLDGISWEKQNRDLIPPVLHNEAQASPDVFYDNGLYHMFFCYRYGTNFRAPERGYRMGYAFSEDLINWHRDDSRSKIEKSKSGWDSESISYPHVFAHKSEIYMLYLGNHVGKDGIGIARLDRHEN